ncbi:MAG: hypothetical protein AAF389_11535 [Gemmatimonadota bacterium]
MKRPNIRISPRVLVPTVLIVAVLTARPLLAADASGVWDVTLLPEVSNTTLQFDLRQDGRELHGTVHATSGLGEGFGTGVAQGTVTVSGDVHLSVRWRSGRVDRVFGRVYRDMIDGRMDGAVGTRRLVARRTAP